MSEDFTNSPSLSSGKDDSDASLSPGIAGERLILHALEVFDFEGSTRQQKIRVADIVSRFGDERVVNLMWSLMYENDYRLNYRAKTALSHFEPSVLIPGVLDRIGSKKEADRQVAVDVSTILGENFLASIDGILHSEIFPGPETQGKVARKGSLERAQGGALKSFEAIMKNLDISKKIGNQHISRIVDHLFWILENRKVAFNYDYEYEDTLQYEEILSSSGFFYRRRAWGQVIISILGTVGTPDVETRLFSFLINISKDENGLFEDEFPSHTLKWMFPGDNGSFFAAKQAYKLFEEGITEQRPDKRKFGMIAMDHVGWPKNKYENICKFISDSVDDRASDDDTSLRIIVRLLRRHGTFESYTFLKSLYAKVNELMQSDHSESLSMLRMELKIVVNEMDGKHFLAE